MLKTGEAPIQMRITITGQFVEMYTQRKIPPSHWHQKKERAIGKAPQCIEINMHLDMLRTKVQEIHSKLSKDGIPINAQLLKEKLAGREGECKSWWCADG